jgi:signal transduction histidine kinase
VTGGSDDVAAVEGAASAPPTGEQGEGIAGALRAIALRAAEHAAGGVALIYGMGSGKEGSGLRLRAAAGFPKAGEARSAAAELLGAVQEVVRSGNHRTLPATPGLGARGMGGTVVMPLGFEGRVQGALVAAGPQPISLASVESLALLAAVAAIRIDHTRVSGENEVLQKRLSEIDQVADQKSDEILKLSETLFAQDIELLRNQEKLGKIEKLKNDFIEKMSRELRTPLNSIIESVISVLANENDALSDSAKAGLRSALDDGTAFLRTLQNILDLWRIKQGELPVEIHEVSFREVVDEAIFSVQDTLGDKPVVIEKHLTEPFPKFRTDLAKLNQILFLLLDNAAKFTPKGRVTIRAAVKDGELECELEDTGIGICPDDQQYVFDEFYQVDELESTRYRGAGLGLALVRDLLVLLEGGISLSSEVGRGTKVTFHLPVQVLR